MRGVALAAVLVVLAAVGCGGSKSSSTSNLTPLAAVKQAATKTADQPSEHLALKGSVTVNGQPVVVTGNGDFKDRTGSMSLDFNVAGLSGSIDAVVDGTDLYMSSPLFSDSLPNGKKWVKLDLQKAGKARGLDLSTVAGQAPATTLKELGALSKVTEVGDEQVGGTDTTHYRGKLAKTATHPAGTYDVWVGKDDGYVRRVQVASQLGPQQRLQSTLDFSDFGKDVNVKVPSPSETADATNLSIPGLGG
jgi:hypothetical protein